MTSRHAAMSAEAAALYQQLRSKGLEIPRRENIGAFRDAVRAGFEDYIQTALEAFAGSIKMIDVAGISCRQLTPPGWSAKQGLCILYAYGGGYVSGSTYEDQVLTTRLASHSGARVVMVEYRLSPEHPYPQPQHDMHQVYPALLDKYGADRLVVSGE